MARWSKTAWRDLDVAQMATWDDAPRRLIVGLLALLIAALVGFYAIAPMYGQWRQAQAHNLVLQQQYVTAAESAAHAKAQKNTPAALAIQPLAASQKSFWFAQLASDAEATGLTKISVKPMATPVVEGDKSKTSAGVGQVVVQVNGSYGVVLQWLARVSAMPQVLSVNDIEISSATHNDVQAQVRLDFAQEVLP